MSSEDRSFDSGYNFESLAELPQARQDRMLYFPGGSAAGGKDGAVVKIIPADSPIWVGVFAFGNLSPKGINGVFTCPNPEEICVAARGACYIVNVNRPSDNKFVKAEPVFGIYPIPSAGLIVFSDYLHLAAYNRRGLAWETGRLSWDGLRVEKITANHIQGKGWSSPESRFIDFTVDLYTGIHRGGSSP